MNYKLTKVVSDFLALRGESPDLLPTLEEGEDSAVLTLAARLEAELPAAAIAATVMTPASLLGDTAKAIPEGETLYTILRDGKAPDYLKPYGQRAYVPLPAFTGKTLTMAPPAYHRMLHDLIKKVPVS